MQDESVDKADEVFGRPGEAYDTAGSLAGAAVLLPILLRAYGADMLRDVVTHPTLGNALGLVATFLLGPLSLMALSVYFFMLGRNRRVTLAARGVVRQNWRGERTLVEWQWITGVVRRRSLRNSVRLQVIQPTGLCRPVQIADGSFMTVADMDRFVHEISQRSGLSGPQGSAR